MSESPDVPRMLLGLAADDELIARSLLSVQGMTDAGVQFPFTHDLNGLLGLCEKTGIEVPHELAGVGVLSVFAVRLRYDASPAAHLDREQALTWAASALAWARSTLERADAQ